MNNTSEVVANDVVAEELASMRGKLSFKEMTMIGLKTNRTVNTLHKYMAGEIKDEDFRQRLFDLCNAYIALRDQFNTGIQELKF